MKKNLISLLIALSSCSSGGGDSAAKWGTVESINSFRENEFTRADHCLAHFDDSVLVWGGSGFNTSLSIFQSFNTGFNYKLTDNSYNELLIDDQTPSERHSHQCAMIDGIFFVWGGKSFTGSSLKSGSFYDPDVGNWTKIPETNAPSQTFDNSFVQIDKSLISWGGGSVGVNSGAVYNFENNTWNEMPTRGGPAARTRHSTVKTASGMIVWGGVKGSIYYNDGFIFDLNSNTWTEINDDGAPEGRESHLAVWTGDKMIVWGGLNESGYSNTGGIYDLASDSWEEIPESPLRPRSDAVTAWTGKEMFIWGGQVLETVVNDGAVFNLESEQWTMLEDYGLTPRIGHKATSTIDKIFLFGGWDGPFAKFGESDNKYRNDGVIISF